MNPITINAMRIIPIPLKIDLTKFGHSTASINNTSKNVIGKV